MLFSNTGIIQNLCVCMCVCVCVRVCVCARVHRFCSMGAIINVNEIEACLHHCVDLTVAGGIQSMALFFCQPKKEAKKVKA